VDVRPALVDRRFRCLRGLVRLFGISRLGELPTQLVGGIVRDAVLGRPLATDIDLTTDARPERTTELVRGWADAVWDQGARFGTVGLKKAGTVFEVTTHRAEAYSRWETRRHT